MKLKKMKKTLRNIERGAVTVSKKDKKYDLTDYPEKWNNYKVIDSYKKDGGITLVIEGKSGKKKSDTNSSNIDESIARLQKNLDNLSKDSDQEDNTDYNKHDIKDKLHDTLNDKAEKKADELIHDSHQSESKRNHDKNRNQRYRQNHERKNSNSSNIDWGN